MAPAGRRRASLQFLRPRDWAPISTSWIRGPKGAGHHRRDDRRGRLMGAGGRQFSFARRGRYFDGHRGRCWASNGIPRSPTGEYHRLRGPHRANWFGLARHPLSRKPESMSSIPRRCCRALSADQRRDTVGGPGTVRHSFEQESGKGSAPSATAFTFTPPSRRRRGGWRCAIPIEVLPAPGDLVRPCPPRFGAAVPAAAGGAGGSIPCSARASGVGDLIRAPLRSNSSPTREEGDQAQFSIPRSRAGAR